MVSIGISALGRTAIQFVEPGVKINGDYYRIHCCCKATAWNARIVRFLHIPARQRASSSSICYSRVTGKGSPGLHSTISLAAQQPRLESDWLEHLEHITGTRIWGNNQQHWWATPPHWFCVGIDERADNRWGCTAVV